MTQNVSWYVIKADVKLAETKARGSVICDERALVFATGVGRELESRFSSYLVMSVQTTERYIRCEQNMRVL
jgi:hypothetical protein